MKTTWIDRFTEPQMDALLALMRNEWWCADRERDAVHKMMSHSDVTVGALDEGGILCGFARVLTDYTYKALIFDVIVHPDYRGTGLGKEIVDRILTHPDLAQVQSFELYCPDTMSGFYRKLGFAVSDSKLHFARQKRPA